MGGWCSPGIPWTFTAIRDEETALFLGDAVVMPRPNRGRLGPLRSGSDSVNNHRNSSSAQIMLRPEQLQLASVVPPRQSLPVATRW
jgi:hypothetical protein